MVSQFEDLRVWKKAHELCCHTFSISNSIRSYAIKDQLERASLSVPLNIAEGFNRRSRKEFVRFLNISLASCSEVKAILYVVRSLELLENDPVKQSFKLIDETRAMLSRLIFSLNDSQD